MRRRRRSSSGRGRTAQVPDGTPAGPAHALPDAGGPSPAASAPADARRRRPRRGRGRRGRGEPRQPGELQHAGEAPQPDEGSQVGESAARPDVPLHGPSGPRPPRGGIKGLAKRGAPATNGWGRRWMQVVENFHLGGRLARGKGYARQGQVSDIRIDTGLVEGRVQGSQPEPYEVRIQVRTLSGVEEAKLSRSLAAQPRLVARLAAGEMPRDLEKAFGAARLSLFPTRGGDLKTSCTCPGEANPCKHVAAVYCLMGEEFDRDPFLLLRMRGIDRSRLTALLEAQGPAPERGRRRARGPAADRTPVASDDTAESGTERFWQGTALPPGWLGEVRTPPMQAAVLKRAGSFPSWRGSEPFLDALAPVYAEASDRAQEALLQLHATPKPKGP